MWAARCTTCRWTCCCGPRTAASCWPAPSGGESGGRHLNVGGEAMGAGACAWEAGVHGVSNHADQVLALGARVLKERTRNAPPSCFNAPFPD